jgi:hypothetical protein
MPAASPDLECLGCTWNPVNLILWTLRCTTCVHVVVVYVALSMYSSIGEISKTECNAFFAIPFTELVGSQRIRTVSSVIFPTKVM